MADDDLNEDGLERFFAAARSRMPEPSEALMARVLADAEAAMVRRPSAVPVARAVVRPQTRGGAIGAALSAIGGWAGLSGLATATAAGLWIGVAGLADPVTLTGGLFGGSALSVELMPGAGSFDVAAGTGW
jgi:hypothetical protein